MTGRVKRLLVVLLLALAAGPLAPLPASASPPPPIRMLGTAVAGDGGQLVTGVVAAPGQFDVAGLAYEGPDGVQVELRASRDGRRWTSWFPAGNSDDEGPDARSPERGGRRATPPVWTDAARYAQFRVTSPNGPVANLHLSAVDVQGHAESLRSKLGRYLLGLVRAPVPQASAALDRPPIVTRAEWGADERMRRSDPSYGTVNAALVHHTETGNGYSRAQARAVIRGIYAYHVQSNGWNDIGYNFLVDRYGTIYEGRYGGMDKPVVGAQAMGFNATTTGVALLGSFMASSPPPVMLDAADRLLAWRLAVAGVDPGGRVTLVSGGSSKYPAGARVTVPTISGHRDVNDTDCPGEVGYTRLGAIRSAVIRLTAAAPRPTDSGPPTTRLAGGDRYDTAAAVARHLASAPVGEVVLASGEARHLVDSLVAAPLARVKRVPLLPTRAGALPRPTLAELDRLHPTVAWVVGGATAVSETVVRSLASRGISVRRLSGPDASSTALSVARQLAGQAQGAIVASFDPAHLVDGLAASGVAAGLRRPVLLVGHDTVPQGTRAALDALGARDVWAVGGPAAISEQVVRRLGARRIAGADRWSSATAIADAALGAGLSASTYVVVSGGDANLVDALTGGTFGAPVLLTSRGALPAATRQHLRGRRGAIAQTWVLGGEAAVGEGALVEVRDAISR